MTTKDARIGLRMTKGDELLIRQAAAVAGTPVSDFVVALAVKASQQVLADQTLFVADPEGWAKLNELLDRPAQPSPKLKRLLTSPSVFDA